MISNTITLRAASTVCLLFISVDLCYGKACEQTGTMKDGSSFDCAFQSFEELPVLPPDTTNVNYWGNLLTEIVPEAFKNLHNLTILYLNSNAISRIGHDAFKGLSSLTLLHMFGNLITEIPPQAFRDLTLLTILSLWNNQLVNFGPQVFNNMISLRDLDIGGNAITHLHAGLFKDLGQLANLRIDDNQVTYLDESTFQFNSFLNKVHAEQNQITSIEPGLFSNVTYLWEFHVHENNITSIAVDTFEALEQLYEVSFTSNPLECAWNGTNLNCFRCEEDAGDFYLLSCVNDSYYRCTSRCPLNLEPTLPPNTSTSTTSITSRTRTSTTFTTTGAPTLQSPTQSPITTTTMTTVRPTQSPVKAPTTMNPTSSPTFILQLPSSGTNSDEVWVAILIPIALIIIVAILTFVFVRRSFRTRDAAKHADVVMNHEFDLTGRGNMSSANFDAAVIEAMRALDRHRNTTSEASTYVYVDTDDTLMDEVRQDLDTEGYVTDKDIPKSVFSNNATVYATPYAVAVNTSSTTTATTTEHGYSNATSMGALASSSVFNSGATYETPIEPGNHTYSIAPGPGATTKKGNVAPEYAMVDYSDIRTVNQFKGDDRYKVMQTSTKSSSSTSSTSSTDARHLSINPSDSVKKTGV
eukprot:m.96677 g.96677  ORF g.96677 m.96677 type:complete len:638 (+) comp26914_c0_seq1:281-2194(+)